MPVGFYYKMMYKPRWMWPYWEKLIRRIAGLGSIDESAARGSLRQLNLFSDAQSWAVVGRDCTQRTRPRGGASVILIDEQRAWRTSAAHRLGGCRLPDLLRKVTQILDRVIEHATVFGAMRVTISESCKGSG